MQTKENNRKSYYRILNKQGIHYQYYNDDLHRYYHHERKLLRAYSERPTDNSQFFLGHEHRWLLNHEDYYGIELPWATSMTHAAIHLYFAPEIFLMDYSTNGEFSSPSGWSIYDDSNYLIKVYPHEDGYAKEFCVDVHGYSWVSEKLNYSWETNNPSKMPGYCDRQATHKVRFSGHPFHFMPINDHRVKTVYMVQPDNVKFPRAVKNLRFRFQGAGQLAGGNLQWYITQYGQLFTPSNRLVHLKSKFEINGASVCLVDYKPQANKDTERPLVAQKCIDSIGYFDGREIWHVNMWPQYRRWHSSSDLMYIRTNSDNKYNNILIKEQKSGWRDNQSIFTRKDEMRIYNPDRKMCIQIMEEEPIDLYCGQNVLSERTDRPDPIDPSLSKNPGSENGYLSNLPCRPGLPNGEPFHFNPNSPLEDMYVVYSFTEKYVNLRKVIVTWTKVPDIVMAKCYNDLKNTWYSSVVYDNQTLLSQTTELQLDYQVCSKMVLKVLQIDPKRTKCEAGSCMGISKISFQTGYLKTQLTEECNDEAMTEVSKLFYEEPADLPFLTSHQSLLTETYFPLRESYLDAFTILLESKSAISNLVKSIPTVYDPFKVLDQKVAMERCEEGPCLELIDFTKPPIKHSFKALMNYKSKLTLPEMDTPGGSKATAVLSCSAVQLRDPQAYSGYYYIKTSCSLEPIKTYCDFGLKTRSWVVTNAHDYTFTKIKEFHNVRGSADLVKVCTKYGMKLGVVTSTKDIETISLLALEFNYFFHASEGVLIGYDFDCESSGGCSGGYRSLDGSTELNTIVTTYLNGIGKEFVAVTGNQALVLTRGTVMTVPLSDLTATATICEGEELNVIKIKCTVTFADLKSWDKEEAICIEKSCMDKHLAIYGDGVYSPNSSVCLAAEQIGEFRNYDGFKYVRISLSASSITEFKGLEKNGVKSLPMKFEEGPLGYSVIDDFVVDMCPEEQVKLAEKAMSFMQTGSRARATAMLRKLLSNPKLVDSLNSNGRQAIISNIMKKLNQVKQGAINDSDLLKMVNLLGNQQDEPVQQKDYLDEKPSQEYDYDKMQIQRIRTDDVTNNKVNLKHKLMEKHNMNTQVENKHNVYQVQYNNNKINDLNTMRITNQEQIETPLSSMRTSLRNNYVANRSMKAVNSSPVFTPSEGYSQADFPRTGMQLTKFDNYTKNYRKVTYPPDTSSFSEESRDPKQDSFSFKQTTNTQAQAGAGATDSSDQDDAATASGGGAASATGGSAAAPEGGQTLPTAPEPEIVDKPRGLRWSMEFNYDTQQDGYYFLDTGKFTKNKLYKFFVVDGDFTSIRQTMMLDGEYLIMGLYGSTVDGVVESYNIVQKYVNENDEAITVHSAMLPSIDEEYGILKTITGGMLKKAKKMVALAERRSFFLLDKMEAMMVYMPMDLTPKVKGNVPLPSMWMKMVPMTSNQPTSVVNLGSVDQHASGITIETDSSTFHESNIATMLVTRYFKLFDGSLHFSFMSPEKTSIVGAFIRYKDQFNHYKLQFNYEKQHWQMIYINSLSQPNEIIMAEEEMALGVGIWYRVVVTFVRYKFKIRVKPEFDVKEPILEHVLSEENRKIETYKEGFVPAWDATYLDGRLGFYCNHCKGVTYASVAVYYDACYTRPSKFYLLSSLYNTRYIENFKPPKVMSKWDQYIMGDSIDPGDWKISDARFKISAIMPVMPTLNKLFQMGPSNIIYYRDPTLVCRNRCSVSVQMMFENDESGIGAVGFKWVDPSNYYALVVKKRFLPKEDKKWKEKMTNIYIIRMHNSVFKKVTKIKYFNIEKNWLAFKINVIDRFIYVYLDDKLIINELPEPDEPMIVKAAGSYMLGINGTIVKFADLVISEINIPKDTGEKPEEAGNSKFSKPILDEESLEMEEESAAEEEKDDPALQCTVQSSCTRRDMWCEQNNLLSLEPKCRDKFSDLCCAENVPFNTMACKEKVDSSFEVEEVAQNVIDNCLDSAALGLEDNKAINDQCLACCSEKIDYCYDNNSKLKCTERCTSKFPFIQEISTSLEEVGSGESGDENITEAEAEELKLEQENMEQVEEA